MIKHYMKIIGILDDDFWLLYLNINMSFIFNSLLHISEPITINASQELCSQLDLEYMCADNCIREFCDRVESSVYANYGIQQMHNVAYTYINMYN